MSRAAWLGPVLLLGLGAWLAVPADRSVDSSAPATPEPVRIVSLAPSLTEIVVALGAAGRLAGVTRYCEGVDAAIPRVGDLRIELESVLAVRPDLVLAIETRTQAELCAALAREGIAVEVLPAESVADVLAALARLGALLGAEEAAAAWRARIEESLRPAAEAPISGIFIVERQSRTVAGGGSFVDAMLRAAGIANVYGGEPWSYRRVEIEAIVAHDPVIILDASFGDAEPAPFWGRFPELRAVREGGVRPFPPVRPGVGIPAWVERLRAEARARRE